MKHSVNSYPYKVVQNLCDVLNANGYKQRIRDFEAFRKYGRLDYKYIDWGIIDGEDPLVSFGGGICSDVEAFRFLNSRGLIDIDMCWKCGTKSNDLNYTFTSGYYPEIKYKICKNCYHRGAGIPNNSSSCFVATACYESSENEEVMILRSFRDNVLSQGLIGRNFIKFYYTISPFLSRQLLKMPTTRMYVRDKILKRIIHKINKY